MDPALTPSNLLWVTVLEQGVVLHDRDSEVFPSCSDPVSLRIPLRHLEP